MAGIEQCIDVKNRPT